MRPVRSPTCATSAHVHALQAARPESRWTADVSAAVQVAVQIAVTVLAVADATTALGRFLEIPHP